MDKEGNERWHSKLEQHRENRRSLYRSDQHPLYVFKAVTEYNGIGIHEWMEFYEGFWNREKPKKPASLAQKARKEIEEHILGEEKRILKELEDLWDKSQKKEIEKGEHHLRQSCESLKYKAFAKIADLRSARQHELDAEAGERKERRTDMLISSGLGSLLSLIVAVGVAIFSVYLTNQSNRASLDPYIEVSLGEQNRLGMIDIRDDRLLLSIANTGPSDVENLEVYFDTFHAGFDLSRISQDAYRAMPNFSVKGLSQRDSARFEFGTDDGTDNRFVWANIFKNEENVYKKDPRYNGLLLFCRVHARYRRALDKKIFYTTRIFHATRNSLIPWEIAQKREDFLAGYGR